MANVMFETDAARQPRVKPLDLSIVIVTWNSERWIDRCLNSIALAAEGLEYEVVLHDNASSDSTLGVVSRNDAGGRMQVIRSAENSGFAAGTNRSAALSSGRYLFLLNPDCELAPRSLALLVKFLDAHPAVAAAAPLLSDESGNSQRHTQLRRFPTLGMLVAELLLVHKLFPGNASTRRYRYADLDLDAPLPVEQPAAAALLIRREAFDRTGPLDEQFSPAWFEDVDYCQRLAHAGLQIWVVPAARGRHFGGASLHHMEFDRFADIWYRNMWRYARKWMRPGEVETLRLAIIFGMAIRWAIAMAGFAPKVIGRAAAMRAYAGVLRKAFRRWEEGGTGS